MATMVSSTACAAAYSELVGDYYCADAPCCAIHWRTSSTRQTVTRSESFSGAGNVRACTRRHRVDLEMGTKVRTCGWRRKPVSGNAGQGGAAGESADGAAGKGTRDMIDLSSALSRQRS